MSDTTFKQANEPQSEKKSKTCNKKQNKKNDFKI